MVITKSPLASAPIGNDYTGLMKALLICNRNPEFFNEMINTIKAERIVGCSNRDEIISIPGSLFYIDKNSRDIVQ